MTTDYSAARLMMVDRQIRTCDVTNPDVLDAFLEVPREQFLPDALRPLAYSDNELEPEGGRPMATPAQLARLVQAAAVRPDEVALVIGCGSGYTAAILSCLASSVVAVESDAEQVAVATERLSELGYANVVVVEGDLTAGFASEGPYDIIFIDGAIGRLPDAIAPQLKEGGRLVAVTGTGNAAYARLWIKEGGDISARRLFNCAVHPLPGYEKIEEFVL